MTDERFAKLSAGYEAEQKGLEGTIKELSEQITQKTDKTINIDRFMKLVKKHTSFEELTPTLLNTFIEKILVHEVEIDAEGKKHQEIEIVYNFIGSVELPEEATHEEASKPVELPKRESRRSKKSAWNTADLHSTLRVSLSLLYFLKHLFFREWTGHKKLSESYNELKHNFDTLRNEKSLADQKIQNLEQQLKTFQKTAIDNPPH